MNKIKISERMVVKAAARKPYLGIRIRLVTTLNITPKALIFSNRFCLSIVIRLKVMKVLMKLNRSAIKIS